MATDTTTGDIEQVVREYRAALLREELRHMEEMAEAWARMSKGLTKDIEELSAEVAELAKAGEKVPIGKVHKLDSYKRTLAQVEEQSLAFADYTNIKVGSLQEAYGTLGLAEGGSVVDLAYLNATGDTLAFSTLSDLEAVEALRAGFAADGSPLRELMLREYPDMFEKIEDVLESGLLRGLSPKEIAKRLSAVTEIPLGNALRIARTETLRAYREATRATYEDSGVVTEYKRMATKDTRTCMACIALDGKIYPVERQMGDHPNGRCSMVPIVGGLEPEWQSGVDWFKEQDEATQKEMLGPEVYDSWKDESFEIEDLATVSQSKEWGEQVQRTPLKDLEKKEE